MLAPGLFASQMAGHEIVEMVKMKLLLGMAAPVPARQGARVYSVIWMGLNTDVISSKVEID